MPRRSQERLYSTANICVVSGERVGVKQPAHRTICVLKSADLDVINFFKGLPKTSGDSTEGGEEKSLIFTCSLHVCQTMSTSEG